MGPDLSFAEQRVLGCLLEKQRTTPEQYPLTLNALRLACNQSTNRDPVVELDLSAIRRALEGLARRRFTRLAGASRAAKYRHLLDEALAVDAADQAVLAVLLLCGPQTSGELKLRTERLHRFADPEAVDAQLDGLIARDVAVRLERRPGQKEVRYAHLLGTEAPEVADAGAPPAEPEPEPEAPGEDGLAARVATLEAELRSLREDLARLRADLGA